jgi:pimeloyl-ACP methyl ester carboxylesterase
LTPVLLLHGGLFEAMDADRFWVRPGVADGLVEAGFDVVAPDRLTRASSWIEEADHIASLVTERPHAVVAGSNGCSVGARLAIDHPDLVSRLVLCWPPTAGDPEVDLLQAEAGALLEGETLRGATDRELATLAVPVAIIPSEPANRFHQARTVAALRRLLPLAVVAEGFPETPRPEFRQGRRAFLKTLIGLLTESG